VIRIDQYIGVDGGKCYSAGVPKYGLIAARSVANSMNHNASTRSVVSSGRQSLIPPGARSKLEKLTVLHVNSASSGRVFACRVPHDQFGLACEPAARRMKQNENFLGGLYVANSPHAF
jgi:hypothetical protein